MSYCLDCAYKQDLSEQNVRWNMPQGCKEALNKLLAAGHDLKDFCYCERKGAIRSMIAEIMCDEHVHVKVES